MYVCRHMYCGCIHMHVCERVPDYVSLNVKLVTKCTHKLRQFSKFTTMYILLHVGKIKILLATSMCLGFKGSSRICWKASHSHRQLESGDLMRGSGDLM